MPVFYIYLKLFRALKSTKIESINPTIIVSIMERGTWKELGMTEVQENQKDPNFKVKLKLFFKFEEKQDLRFLVYHVNRNQTVTNDTKEELGVVYCTVGDVVGSRGGFYSSKLSSKNDEESGVLLIKTEGDPEGSKQYLFKMSASKLDNFLRIIHRKLEYFHSPSICHHFKNEFR
jgi:hypothetical protein